MISKSKKRLIILGAVIFCLIAAVLIIRVNGKSKTEVSIREVTPHRGDLQTFISTTGTVLPYNRLAIMPQISGRVEKVLVVEGQHVRIGQILAWMSSTERAALIDAARAQGDKAVKYWEEAYKPIPIVAQINGEVIVRAVEPGQTASTTTAILVLSDRLIVKANVDETDIGRVRVGQKAIIGLDAYPEIKATGRVDLIEYESVTVNNVTTYVVNIVPEKVPPVFRSGMSANINIIEKEKKGALLLPVEAVMAEQGHSYVLVKNKDARNPEKRIVQTGISDEQNIEIVSGIRERENVIVKAQKYIPVQISNGKNPFGPPSPGKKSSK